MRIPRELMDELHACLLGGMIEIDRICRAHRLRYYLFYGTLLGAVRHSGFIPWDDDADIVMPRADYDRFLAIAPGDLPADFFLQFHRTEKCCRHPFAKLRRNHTACIIPEHARIPMHHGIFIDIFPMDIVPRNRWLSACHWHIPRMLERVSAFLTTERPGQRAVYRSVRTLARRLCPAHWPALCADRVAALSRFSTGSEWRSSLLPWKVSAASATVPARWFGDGRQHAFAGVSLSIPEEAERVLTGLYGDYGVLPPVERRVPSHSGGVISATRDYTEFLSHPSPRRR